LYTGARIGFAWQSLTRADQYRDFRAESGMYSREI